MQSASETSLGDYDIIVPSETGDNHYHPDFASPDGDVILASKDCKAMFRTHSYILKTTSGFFRSMFSLPKTSTTPRSAELIYLNDDETTLEHLLRMVSGLPLLPLSSCERVDSVLHAAETYEMPGAMSIVRLAITTPPLSDHPLHMYGLCCRYGWQAEAKMFSSRTLTYNLHDPAHRECLERMSTSALLKLFALHRGRRESLRQRLDDPPFVSGNPAVCVQCSGVIEYHTWRELKYKIILEMDARPLGDTISQGLLDWPEAKACWRAGCPNIACSRLLYDKIETLRVIKDCIEKLPDST